MDVVFINSSETPVSYSDNFLSWTLSSETKLLIERANLVIEVVAFVAVLMVFLVARYMVKEEKKIGMYI